MYHSIRAAFPDILLDFNATEIGWLRLNLSQLFMYWWFLRRKRLLDWEVYFCKAALATTPQNAATRNTGGPESKTFSPPTQFRWIPQFILPTPTHERRVLGGAQGLA